ncbi:MAG: hypothetical protein WBC05_00885 [Sedimentisphaerales bacterium]
MKKREKNEHKKNEYYFGGPVPRDIQKQMDACRDRGMTKQTISKKLAYLWLSLPEEKQNQLYLCFPDEVEPNDKVVIDLMRAVDVVIEQRILALMPKSVKVSS